MVLAYIIEILILITCFLLYRTLYIRKIWKDKNGQQVPAIGPIYRDISNSFNGILKNTTLIPNIYYVYHCPWQKSKIVLNDPELIQDFYSKSGTMLREKDIGFGWWFEKIMGNGVGLFSTDSKEFRNIYHVFNSVNTSKYLDNINMIIKADVDLWLKHLFEKNEIINIDICHQFCRNSLFNIIYGSEISKLYYPQFLECEKLWMNMIKIAHKHKWLSLPIFQYIPNVLKKEVDKFNYLWYKLHDNIFDHIDKNTLNSSTMLDAVKNHRALNLLTKDQIYQTFLECTLFNFEVLSNTILFLIINLSKISSNTFESIKKEIDFSMHDNIQYRDFSKLKWPNLIIGESSRLCPVINASHPELSSIDVKLNNGLIIPKKTPVSVYNLSVRHNNGFENPNSFIPDRFDTRVNTLNLSLQNIKDQQFGQGKRKCLGKQFAYMVLGWIIIIIAHNYRVSILDGIEEKSATSDSHVVMSTQTKAKITSGI